MKYLIKQRIFSFGDNFTIKDEYQNDIYVVEGKVFTIGNKLRLLDLNGNELFYIEQQLFKLLPEYYIRANGEVIAVVKKQLSLFTPKFFIDSDLGAYTIVGDVFAYDFQIYKDGNAVATISKKWFSFSDSYGVDIADGEDHAFILALAIVIDQVLHDNRKNH